MRRLIEWLADLKIAVPQVGGPLGGACPLCKASPFPGGTCDSCGYTRPPERMMPLFSSDNAIPIIILALFGCVILGAVFAIVLEVFT